MVEVVPAALAQPEEAAVGGSAAGSAAGSGPSPFTEVASVLKAAQRVERNRLDAEQLAALELEDAGERAEVTCRRPVPGMDVLVLDDVLSARECAYLVRSSEQDMSYSFWDSKGERAEAKSFRDADTVETRAPALAALLWRRAGPWLRAPVEVAAGDDGSARWQRDLAGRWLPVGTNEDVLFARYRPGGHFAPHTDGYSVVDCDHRSMYSIVLFLNTCASGGGTRFYSDAARDELAKDAHGRYTARADLVLHTVESAAGRMVVFFHNILHEGVPVGAGAGAGAGAEKYIIRSDVMYEREEPVCKTPRDREAFQLYQDAQEQSVAGDTDAAMHMFRRAFKLSPALAEVYGM